MAASEDDKEKAFIALLRPLLEPIVTDETLTGKQRSDKFFPIMQRLVTLFDGDNEAMFNLWNLTMAEIVRDNKLGRQ